MATTQYKTPGVYIQEPNSFPPSIVGVDTAVPCFIGYTYMANDSDGRDLNMTPKRVESMAEFAQFFGGGYPESYYLVPKGNDGKFTVPPADNDWGAISFDGVNIYHLAEVGRASFNLYNSMRLFYANGGGSCYVISCGVYGGLPTPPSIAPTPLKAALDVGKTFIGPTMVAIPDAVLLSATDFADVASHMLNTCAEAGDRMTGQRCGDDRRHEHEVDEAERHPRQRQRLAHQHEIHVGEGADEREQDQETDGERRAERRVAQVPGPHGKR